jgi:hypothetical protein
MSFHWRPSLRRRSKKDQNENEMATTKHLQRSSVKTKMSTESGKEQPTFAKMSVISYFNIKIFSQEKCTAGECIVHELLTP